MRYVAADGKVWAVKQGKLVERTSALTSNARDIARFETAARRAQLQRERQAA